MSNHANGIWRHLKPRLAYLKQNWWKLLKETGWSILWPFPKTISDLTKIGGLFKGAWENFKGAKIRDGIENVLLAWRQCNALVGRYYGWIFLASVLIGGVIGAIGGAVAGMGVGAIPGAVAGIEAGAGVAAKIGYGILLSAIGAEVSIIAKSISDIHAAKNQDAVEHEYDQIADSSLALGIMGSMALLGALAARFARAVGSRAAAFLKKTKFWQKKLKPIVNIAESWNVFRKQIPKEATGKIPKNWEQLPANKEVGWRWRDPKNKSGNHVRIDKAENVSDTFRQIDHVHVFSDGKHIGKNGMPVYKDRMSQIEFQNQTHIPLTEYVKWSKWNGI